MTTKLKTLKNKILSELIWLVGIYIAAIMLLEFMPGLSRFDDHMMDNLMKNNLNDIPSYYAMVFDLYCLLLFFTYLVRCLKNNFRAILPAIILLISIGVQLFIIHSLQSVYFSILALFDMLPPMTHIDTSDGPYHLPVVIITILLAAIFLVTGWMMVKNRKQIAG